MKKHTKILSILAFAISASAYITPRHQPRQPSPTASDGQELVLKGETIYKQLCISCHGVDGKGVALGGTTKMAPPLVGSARVNSSKEAMVKILLNGMAGPVDGVSYPAIMPALGAGQTDEWVAAVVSYVRQRFGEKKEGAGLIVHAAEVKALRQTISGRAKPWTQVELETQAEQKSAAGK
jgi:Cytochrome c, mono- and diheme variants